MSREVGLPECGFWAGARLKWSTIRIEVSMKLMSIRSCLISFCIVLALGCVQAEGSDLWFRKRVTWRAGTQPRVWETEVVSPNGKERFRLALVPLWCVEGGILQIEILLASPDHPDENLLGFRDNDVPQPFVITAEELTGGIKKSRFGDNRAFNARGAKVRIKILDSRLGAENCQCGQCIQEFTAELSVQSK
jgi:hypothetical protein